MRSDIDKFTTMRIKITTAFNAFLVKNQ